MPRFSLKRVFVSVTLIAIGLAMCAASRQWTLSQPINPPLIYPMVLFMGIIVIWAGAMSLFQKRNEVVLGVVILVVFALAIGVVYALLVLQPRIF